MSIKNKLKIKEAKGGRMVTDIVSYTPSDRLTLKSFITLPEQYVQYSHINLPATSIYLKSKLNQTNFNYWELLKIILQ